MRTWRKGTNGKVESLYYDGITIYYDKLRKVGGTTTLRLAGNVVARLESGRDNIEGEP